MPYPEFGRKNLLVVRYKTLSSRDDEGVQVITYITLGTTVLYLRPESIEVAGYRKPVIGIIVLSHIFVSCFLTEQYIHQSFTSTLYYTHSSMLGL